LNHNKKKLPVALFAAGLLFSVYIGYLLSGVWENEITVFDFVLNLNKIIEKPFANYFNQFTVKTILISITSYILVFALYITSRKNFMMGREFGSAEFATPKQANMVLKDKKDEYNRLLSQNLRMSLDFRKLKLNGNILICGGSGAGKTFFFVMPNLMQMPERTSFLCLDPKGEILRNCGTMLKDNGYNIKVLNLVEMDKSDCYNPFVYIREETDIIKLVTNLIANTTPKGSKSNDPFWERAESLLLQALFYYVWLEEKGRRQNFGRVMELLNMAEVTEPGRKSALTEIMEQLAETSSLGANHPAVKQYNKCIRGAGDTVRSIIISANSRLALLENKKILRILANDEMDIADLGIGVNGDKKTRTALFCVIPDNEKSYNFIVGMLYTQIFQELYYQADFIHGGRLPIHVTLMMDEFCNVALPDDYCSLLSTMRSREISSVIIIQNFAQLKALFEKTWETVPGNCDTFIYLGGNEQSSHKYVSELLGKSTIDKRTHGESKGRHGNASRNYDVLGRELFTPDEVRKLDNKKCIIFIRGLNPILDNKYNPFTHKRFKQTANGAGKPYTGSDKSKPRSIGKSISYLTEESLKNYEQQKEKGANVNITKISYQDLINLPDDEPEKNKKLKPIRKLKPEWDDTITNRMINWKYTDAQIAEVKIAMESGVREAFILEYFYPDISVEQMKEGRKAE